MGKVQTQDPIPLNQEDYDSKLKSEISLLIDEGFSDDDILLYGESFKSKYSVKKKDGSEPTSIKEELVGTPTTKDTSTPSGTGEADKPLWEGKTPYSIREIAKDRDNTLLPEYQEGDPEKSSVKMATEVYDGKWYSFPTLFPKDPDSPSRDPNDWEEKTNHEEAFKEAMLRGEAFGFGKDKEAAISFGEGSWKKPEYAKEDIPTVENIPEASEELFKQRQIDNNLTDEFKTLISDPSTFKNNFYEENKPKSDIDFKEVAANLNKVEGLRNINKSVEEKENIKYQVNKAKNKIDAEIEHQYTKNVQNILNENNASIEFLTKDEIFGLGISPYYAKSETIKINGNPTSLYTYDKMMLDGDFVYDLKDGKIDVEIDSKTNLVENGAIPPENIKEAADLLTRQKESGSRVIDAGQHLAKAVVSLPSSLIKAGTGTLEEAFQLNKEYLSAASPLLADMYNTSEMLDSAASWLDDQTQIYGDGISASFKKGNVGDALFQITNAGFEMAPLIAASMVNPGLAPGLFGLQAYGDKLSSLQQEQQIALRNKMAGYELSPEEHNALEYTSFQKLGNAGATGLLNYILFGGYLKGLATATKMEALTGKTITELNTGLRIGYGQGFTTLGKEFVHQQMFFAKMNVGSYAIDNISNTTTTVTGESVIDDVIKGTAFSFPFYARKTYSSNKALMESKKQLINSLVSYSSHSKEQKQVLNDVEVIAKKLRDKETPEEVRPVLQLQLEVLNKEAKIAKNENVEKIKKLSPEEKEAFALRYEELIEKGDAIKKLGETSPEGEVLLKEYVKDEATYKKDLEGAILEAESRPTPKKGIAKLKDKFDKYQDKNLFETRLEEAEIDVLQARDNFKNADYGKPMIEARKELKQAEEEFKKIAPEGMEVRERKSLFESIEDKLGRKKPKEKETVWVDSEDPSIKILKSDNKFHLYDGPRFLTILDNIEDAKRELKQYKSQFGFDVKQKTTTQDETQEKTSKKSDESIRTEKISDKEVLPKKEDEIAPTPRKVKEVINRPVTLKEHAGAKLETPIEGEMYVDGQRVVIEDNKGNIYDIGNVKDISESDISEIGVEHKTQEFEMTKEGDVVVSGKTWKVQKDLPDDAIEYDNKGNVKAISLSDGKGKTIMFLDQQAEDIVYNKILKEVNEKSPKEIKEINKKLESDEEFKNELRKAEEDPKEVADKDTKPSAEKQEDLFTQKPIKVKEQEIVGEKLEYKPTTKEASKEAEKPITKEKPKNESKDKTKGDGVQKDSKVSPRPKSKGKKGSLRGKTPLDKRKIKDKAMLSSLDTEATDPHSVAQQFFIGGGRVLTTDIKALLGSGEEARIRQQYARTKAKNGKNINDISEDLWREYGEQQGVDLSEFKDAVETVIREFNSPKAMALDFNKNHGIKQATNESGEALIETPQGMMTQKEIDNLVAHEEARKTNLAKNQEQHNEAISLLDKLTDKEMVRLEKERDLSFEKFLKETEEFESRKPEVNISKQLKLNSLVENIDKAIKDVDEFGKETLGMNFPVAVAKPILLAMKTAAITAKTTADIISAGINALIKTKWYKSLSKGDKADVVDNFETYINRPYKENPKKPRPTIEQEVDLMQSEGYSEKAIIDNFTPRRERMIAQDYLNRQKPVTHEEAQKITGKMFDKARKDAKEKFENPASRNKLFRKFARKVSDRQFEPKFLLKKAGGEGNVARNYIVTSKGASGYAKFMFDETYSKVYKGLSQKTREIQDEVIILRRVIAIDQNRNKNPDVVHPGFINEQIALKQLENIKKQLGDKKYNNIIKRTDEYFNTFRVLLDDMHSSGIINKESRDRFFDIDYQPREFLEFLKNMENDLDILESGQDTASLKSDQIKKLEDGSDKSLVLKSEYLISRAINVRAKAAAMNRANKKVAEFIKTRGAEIKKLKAQEHRTKKENKEIKYYEELADRVKLNPIVGFKTKGKNEGDPIYLNNSPPKDYTSVYYYVNGVKNIMFMENNFHTQYNDVATGFFDNQSTKNTVALLAGVPIVKALATGYNPTFFMTNTPRDFMFISTFSDVYGGFVPYNMAMLAGGTVKAMRDMNTKNSNFRNFVKYGGLMNFLHQQGKVSDSNEISSSLSKLVDPRTKEALKWTFNAATFKNLQMYSEIGFRVAVFNRSVKQQMKKLKVSSEAELNKKYGEEGKDMLEDIYTNAAASARNTTDFNQGGTIIKDLDALIPYINAATQGTKVMADAMRDRPGQTALRMVQSAIILSAAPIAASMAGFAFLRDRENESEEDRELSSVELYLKARAGVSLYDRTNYMIAFTGKRTKDGEFDFIRIAKPHSLTPFLGLTEGIAVRAMKNMVGDNSRSQMIEQIGFAFENNISPLDFSISGNIAKIPTAKASMQMLTGVDFYRNQDLSYLRGDVPQVVEGYESERVEEFYKIIGEKMNVSPARFKSAVESYITTPSTSPYIGVMYGGLDALTSDQSNDKMFSKLKKDLKKSTFRRIKKETSDFNRRMERSKIMKKKLEKIAIKDQKMKLHAKRLINKYNEGEIKFKEVFDNILEVYKDSPYDANRLVKRAEDAIENPDVASVVWELKYSTAKERAVLLVNMFGEDLLKFKGEKKGKIKLRGDMENNGVFNEETIFEYNKLVKEIKKEN